MMGMIANMWYIGKKQTEAEYKTFIYQISDSQQTEFIEDQKPGNR